MTADERALLLLLARMLLRLAGRRDVHDGALRRQICLVEQTESAERDRRVLQVLDE